MKSHISCSSAMLRLNCVLLPLFVLAMVAWEEVEAMGATGVTCIGLSSCSSEGEPGGNGGGDGEHDDGHSVPVYTHEVARFLFGMMCLRRCQTNKWDKQRVAVSIAVRYVIVNNTLATRNAVVRLALGTRWERRQRVWRSLTKTQGERYTNAVQASRSLRIRYSHAQHWIRS